MSAKDGFQRGVNFIKKVTTSKMPTWLKVTILVVIGVILLLILLICLVVVIAVAEDEEEKTAQASSSSYVGTITNETIDWFYEYINYVEGGNNTIEIKDGKEYYKVIKIGDGKRTVGHGLTLEDDYNELDSIAAEYGIEKKAQDFIADDYMLKEWVDEAQELVIQKDLDSVKNLYSGLQPYQYCVLVSQKYQKGSVSTDYYSDCMATWDSSKTKYGEFEHENDWKYEDLNDDDRNWGNGFFDDPLAQCFLEDWDYACENFPGLKNRRRADYIMFKTGWNMITGTYCPMGNSGGVSDGTGWWLPMTSSKTEYNKEGIVISAGMYYSSGSWHGAVDMYNSTGSGIIIASRAGTVSWVQNWKESDGTSGNSSYGNAIKIDHGDGYSSLYAHMLNFEQNFNIGDQIEQGQILGISGETGNAYGVHLHFEIRDNNGTRLNPQDFISLENPYPRSGSE